jgi:hypothetical protein
MERLAAFQLGGQHPLYVKYDPVFDALIILLVSPQTETVVHYVDQHVGLLYTPDDLEIVGLQVEAFERSFLPQHDSLQRVWRLSDASAELKDAGDVILAFAQVTPRVAQEVARATEPILGKAGQAFTRAVAYTYAA